MFLETNAQDFLRFLNKILNLINKALALNVCENPQKVQLTSTSRRITIISGSSKN
jgi:hypothetical protein